MGLKGKKKSDGCSSFASTSNFNMSLDNANRTGLFDIRVIPKNTKINTLIDYGSEENLISE